MVPFMIKATRKLLFSLLLLPAFTLASAASLPTVDVAVTNSAGKSVYKGATDAKGTFSTGKLAPGDYVVQFTAKNPGKGNFALAANAGKNQMAANSVAASRLSDPGVAMKIKVQGDTSITGQVAEAGKLAQAPAQSASVPTSIAGHRTKVENGKTYVWLTDSVGSVAGGHWAELNSAEAQAVVGVVGQKPTQTRTAPSQMRSY